MTDAKTVMRFDRGKIREARMDAQGFLRAPATVTRAGVFTYMMPSGRVRRELRPPDEVFSERNLESIRGTIVTNEHPVNGTPVTAENVKEFQVGHADSDVVAEEGMLRVGLVITDAETIRDIRSGKKQEVSCGYRCTIDHTSGVWQGPNGPEPYDVIQRGHVNNHIAVTRKGRGGPEVRLHLDSEDGVEIQTTQENTMSTVKLEVDGVGVDLDAAAAVIIKPALEKRDSRVTELEADIKAAKAEQDTLQAKYDQAQTDLKDAKDKLDKTDSVDVNAAVKARLAVLDKASKVLDKDALSKLDDASDLDIVKACVTSKGVEIEGKSDDYVLARFDAIVESMETEPKKDSHKQLGAALVGGATDNDRAAIQKRLDAAIARQDSAWKFEARGTTTMKEDN